MASVPGTVASNIPRSTVSVESESSDCDAATEATNRLAASPFGDSEEGFSASTGSAGRDTETGVTAGRGANRPGWVGPGLGEEWASLIDVSDPTSPASIG
jgi:hypothetical protein